MILAEVLHHAIEDGLADARAAHDGRDADALRGAMDAADACRGLEPGELADLLCTAAVARVDSPPEGMSYARAYEVQVLRVAQIISCALSYHNLPPISDVPFPARMRYAAIVGRGETDSTHTR